MALPSSGSPARTSRRQRLFLALGAVAVVLIFVIIALLPRDANQEATKTTTPTESATESPAQMPWLAENHIIATGYDPYPPIFRLPDASTLTAEPITAGLALEPDATPFGGTIGFSFEGTDLASPLWASETSNIDEMLAGIEEPALRFGGLRGDRSMWWTSSDEPAPEWAQVTVTPADLERVNEVAESADASVTLVVSLARYDPDRAADMAAHAREIFGDRLLAITIGNEPNGYFLEDEPEDSVRDDTWDTNDYQEGVAEYSEAIEAASPGTPFAGPGAYDAPWWRAYADIEVSNTQALTMHWYPLWDCDGPASSSANPTLEDLTSPQIRENANRIVGMGADAAADYDLPLWIEETGPTSCPGTNETSRTHAQALWTTDYVLTAAELGAERMAFHSTLMACQGGAPMSPVCATGSYGDPGEILEGRTSYLALMQLGWIPNGVMLAPTVSGDGHVMVHGVLGDDGSLTVVVTDMRDPAATGDAVPVEVSAPTGLEADAPSSWSPALGSQLSGAAHDAQESTLTAMVPVGSELAELVLDDRRPLTVASEPGSATVLVLEPLA